MLAFQFSVNWIQKYSFKKEHPLDGGFKYFLFSPLFGEDSHFDKFFLQGVETTN